MYQIKHLFLLATLAIGIATGLPSQGIHGNQESCLKEHNLCALSSDTISSFTLCNQKLIVCLEPFLALNKDEKVSPGLTIQISTSLETSVDGGLAVPNLYCPQPGDGEDESCTVVCPPDDQYLPHPTDCGKYCACAAGIPFSMSCPPNLDYDQDRNTCDYPENANCHVLPECQNPSSTATFSIDVALDDPSSKYRPQSDDDGNKDCEVICEDDDGFYPNPADCNSFYQCSEGTPILQPCPAGLQFNKELLVCDYPADANCHVLPECQAFLSASTSHSKTDGEMEAFT